MKINPIKIIIKGFCIGATMLVPGVSGGSMAMILGIYQDLISSVSSFFKKKNALFLLLFLLGSITGMVLCAKPLLNLIEWQPKIVLFFFMGAVAGSVPMIYRKAQVRRASVGTFLYLILGIVIVLAFSLIPAQLFAAPPAGVWGIVIQILGGVIASVALVLPGISVSYMLLLMGLYEPVMAAIGGMQFVSLIPLAAGLVGGILLTTRLLERAMLRYPQPTYLIILGFVLGSVIQVFPGVPYGVDILWCALTAAAGFGAIYFLSKKEV